MDVVSDGVLDESARSPTVGHIYDILAVNNSPLRNLSTTCSLCHRILLSENEPINLEAASLCGDCNFLLLEDVGPISPYDYQRRTPGSRRRRYGSSESVESLFSQQFSRMITLERPIQSMVFEHDNISVNGDGPGRLVRQTSSRTTPIGSRRWRRVLSDNESDGFDSLYAESESNASFREYRHFHGGVDTLSYSAYGGESDISVDGQSFLENENFYHPDGGSGLESDTDIDPMNAGFYPWNSDQEYEDEDGDSEWDEAIVRENMVESSRTGDGSSTSNRNNVYVDWGRQIPSPEVEGSVPLRISGRTREHSADFLSNFEVLEAPNYVGDSGDYLNSRGFESLLEHLAETESSRRGAPPAAISFVKNMVQLRIDAQHDNLENLSCAICKESLTVGIVVNQLPCFHIYHPSCIFPWLTARNTCPLCRYELPTDDKDYEEMQRRRGNRFEMRNIHQHDANEDSSGDTIDDAVTDELSQLHHGVGEQEELINEYSVAENSGMEIPRNRWFFLAAVAAPIVSMVGISLMLWLGKPSPCRRWPVCHNRRDNGQRRWWSIF